MDIEQLRKDILKGRDLSVGEHEDLISQKINEFIVYSTRREHDIINNLKVFLHELESGPVVKRAVPNPKTQTTYISEQEAAKLIGVTTRTLVNWEKSGVFLGSQKIKSSATGRSGRHWFRSDILKWIKGNQKTITNAKNKGRGASKTDDQSINEFAGHVEKLMDES